MISIPTPRFIDFLLGDVCLVGGIYTTNYVVVIGQPADIDQAERRREQLELEKNAVYEILKARGKRRKQESLETRHPTILTGFNSARIFSEFLPSRQDGLVLSPIRGDEAL